MNISLISSSGKRHSIRLAVLREHFHYFSHSRGWIEEGGRELTHTLSFSDEVLDRLDDALVSGTCPPLLEEDVALIDYLQPKNSSATYLCYRLYDGDWSLSFFESSNAEPNNLALFLEGFSPNYINYLSERGWDRLSHIDICEKNLEDLWNQCMVHYSLDGLSGVEEFLSTTKLVKIWYGANPNHELFSEVKQLVIDCAMRKIEDPSTSRDELYLLVSSLVPDMVEKNESFSLPWSLVLPEGDTRAMSIHACSVGRLPLKKDIKLPYDPYWDE